SCGDCGGLDYLCGTACVAKCADCNGAGATGHVACVTCLGTTLTSANCLGGCLSSGCTSCIDSTKCAVGGACIDSGTSAGKICLKCGQPGTAGANCHSSDGPGNCNATQCEE